MGRAVSSYEDFLTLHFEEIYRLNSFKVGVSLILKEMIYLAGTTLIKEMIYQQMIYHLFSRNYL